MSRSKRVVIISQSDDGATMVEAAIIFPLFVLILFGIIQFGLLIAAQISLRNASAVAARYATLDSGVTAADVLNAANAALGSSLDPAHINNSSTTVDLDYAVPNTTIVDAKRVVLAYDMPLIIRFPIPNSSATYRLWGEAIYW